MEKLELKHLAHYLPYDLQMKCNAVFRPTAGTRPKIKEASATLTVALLADIEGKVFDSISLFKPILRPLSDLTKEIEVNGERFVPEKWLGNYIKKERNYTNYDTSWIRELQYKKDISRWSYWLHIKLFEWHFDVFGLIEKGLAIDINTLENLK